MGRILAIDYGRKRSGVAVTDVLQLVGNNLATIPTHQLLTWVTQYVHNQSVDRIVVGCPMQLNGQPSETMALIKPFVARLQALLPDIPIVLYDERFTTTLAQRAMIDGGMKKSQRQVKGKADAIAATIILNDYLQSQASSQS